MALNIIESRNEADVVRIIESNNRNNNNNTDDDNVAILDDRSSDRMVAVLMLLLQVQQNKQQRQRHSMHRTERTKVMYSSLLQQQILLVMIAVIVMFVSLGSHRCSGIGMVYGYITPTTTTTTTRITTTRTIFKTITGTTLTRSWLLPVPSTTTSKTTTSSSIMMMMMMMNSDTLNENIDDDDDDDDKNNIDDLNRNIEIIEHNPSTPCIMVRSGNASPTMVTHIRSLDDILSKLTLAFPLFVVWFAVMGLIHPNTLVWINKGPMVTILLALVMFGTGLTLQKSDFSTIWDTKVNRYSVLLGVLCQFIIMPSTAYTVGRFFFLSHLFIPTSHHDIASALFLGLCFVGCSPGGTASNVVTYIANANVALSVVLTSCSTFAAVVVTPLLIQLLLRNTIYGGSSSSSTVATGMIGSSPSIHISGWSLCTSTAKVVLLPIMMGMIFKTRLPNITKTLCRFTPFLSVLFVSMICGGVVAQTATPLLSLSGIGSSTGGVRLFPIILLSVLSLHIIGFVAGYIVPKLVLPKGTTKESSKTNYELTARTISIEVGMQNSALAVVLAHGSLQI